MPHRANASCSGQQAIKWDLRDRRSYVLLRRVAASPNRTSGASFGVLRLVPIGLPCRHPGGRGMTTLFAFLHHLCAFTLVSAVAIELTLIRQQLTLASARRLQVTDLVLGIAAVALSLLGCCAWSTSRRARPITSTSPLS